MWVLATGSGLGLGARKRRKESHRVHEVVR